MIVDGVLSWTLDHLMFEGLNGEVIEGCGECSTGTGKILGYEGIFGEGMWRLAKKLNYTLTFNPPADNKWGNLEPDGTWNGLVRQLIDGEVDIVTCGLTITKERDEVVDYTVPVFQVQRGWGFLNVVLLWEGRSSNAHSSDKTADSNGLL